jgi:alkylhydroperoxidase family enzyme
LRSANGSVTDKKNPSGGRVYPVDIASRIPYPSFENLSPIKHERVFGEGQARLLNVTHMAMHASDGLWAAQSALGKATIRADLDPRLRELVILRVAHLQRSDYELFHHRGLARAAGLAMEDEAALLGGDLSVLAAPDQALAAFVDSVVCDVSPDDAVLTALRGHYDDRFVFDIVILIGSYMMTARLAAVGGVRPEEQPVTGW